jgi:mono/diheme cytochrome c family protein
MNNNSNTIKILFFTAIFCVSCSKEGDPIPDRVEQATKGVTLENVNYKNFIEPVLTKNCSTCHGVDGSAEAWWLNAKTYNNAFNNANIIANTIVGKTMPPPPKFPFTDRDRELFQAWIDRGMPEK